MKVVSLFVVASAAASASASFDLLYVADRGNDMIHRFDGGSRAYLGSIGGGGMLNNPAGVYADASNGRLVVTAENGTFQFDLWNGALLNAVGFYAGGHITKAHGSYTFNTNFNVNYLGAVVPNVDGWYGAPSLPLSATYTATAFRNNVLATVHGGTNWREYSYTALFGAATLTRSVTLAAPATGQIAMSQTSNLHLAASGTTNQVISASTSSNFSSTFNIPNISVVKGVAFGHGDTFYTCGTVSAGNGLVQVMNTNIGYGLGTFGAGILSDPVAISTIIAPEPSSLFAMAAGALLLRRRRKSVH
ncbi:MAG: PEP-CTERM sorting domain-containing protein [Chthonomonas sp.]|nr:PEP-CTERM sorting domain-containing protein [Chthonomonas sp.]